ncbi:MAG: hypothetical protein OZSIB_2808 [Candidatus Ozemobacter sibiricus]|jgi:molecular chaperone GrpE|uniref:Nucleotide exchange factor GrpE n=1 Tax=Candidatus Ozemobacter sibiricus TaxID=2268124 RepID=A0A367ZSA4_9BACT|nr:MAG: hypothetical protein OZSIB_2808 [Candidatus Ozemobacter sibiricus]
MADLPPSPLAALEADLRTLIARAATLEKEKAAALDEGKTRTRRLLLEFIEVADTFETLFRQFEAEPAPAPETAAWVANFRTLYKIHLRALKRHGATPLPSPVGQKVDPHRHQVAEAVAAPGHPPETIIEQLKPGWVWHDELLRPAEVKATPAG